LIKNSLQSLLLGIFGAASFAEGVAYALAIKQIKSTQVVHGTQLAVHEMTLEANLYTMSAIEVDTLCHVPSRASYTTT